jgi:hypothetical protein
MIWITNPFKAMERVSYGGISLLVVSLTVIAWDVGDVVVLAHGFYGDEVGVWVEIGALGLQAFHTDARAVERVARVHRSRVLEWGGARVGGLSGGDGFLRYLQQHEDLLPMATPTIKTRCNQGSLQHIRVPKMKVELLVTMMQDISPVSGRFVCPQHT